MTIVELAPGADEQLVLQAALATGPVHEFARRRVSLTELFRDVVTDAVEDDGRRREGGGGMSDATAQPRTAGSAPWAAVRLVAGREISTRVRSKAYLDHDRRSSRCSSSRSACSSRSPAATARPRSA